MNCTHKHFIGSIRVARLTEIEDSTGLTCVVSLGETVGDEDMPVTGYTTDITVTCEDCGQPFEFIGVPNGYSPLQPMTSIDRTQLRAPIRPAERADKQDLSFLKS